MTKLLDEEQRVVELMRAALIDPRLHRRLETRKGTAMPLRPWQSHIVRRVEHKLSAHDGSWLTVRVSRQAGKNEIAATVHERHLLRNVDIGGCIVRTAPNHRPQLVNSKQRLKSIADRDPLFDLERLQFVEGFQATYGRAKVAFLTAHKDAKMEGATADAMLDVDEAHLTEFITYQEKLSPMTASTNACKVLYGVAAMRTDLLYEMRRKNEELGRFEDNIEIAASFLCEHDTVYRAHYESRVAELGPTHPVIRTQYDLIDLDAMGGAFTAEHRDSLFDSDHARYGRPVRRPGIKMIALLDLAGEEEVDADLAEDTLGREDPDCAVLLLAEVDTTKLRVGKPQVRVVEAFRWQGKRIQRAKADEGESLQEAVMKVMGVWQPDVTLVDSRGVGISTASWLDRTWHGRVIKYAATSPSTTEDLYNLWAFLNLGQLKWFGNDRSPEYQQVTKEMAWARAKYSGLEESQSVNLVKPDSRRKIDMVKCLSYVPRAVSELEGGTVWSFNYTL